LTSTCPPSSSTTSSSSLRHYLHHFLSRLFTVNFIYTTFFVRFVADFSFSPTSSYFVLFPLRFLYLIILSSAILAESASMEKRTREERFSLTDLREVDS
jgi:hypothetical protein